MTNPLDEFTDRRVFPFMTGVYLATNAIADAYVVIDGPSCAFLKSEAVAGTHDATSTLHDVGGRHRVVHSNLELDSVIGGSARNVMNVVRKVHASGVAGAILVGALPMAAITGTSYEDLVEDAALEGGAPVLVLPVGSLDRDWLDGYASVLEALARRLDLPPAGTSPDRVAVVGCMHDRGEGDQRGNRIELVRICAAIGLELVSVWPDGGTVEDLRRAAGAGVVVSLPNGGRAGALLAARTGARLVEAEVPFGPAATADFVRLLGEATGRAAEAESFADAEVARVIERAKRVHSGRFAGRTTGFIGDPWMAPGFCDIAERLGLDLRFLVALARFRPGLEPGGGRLPAGAPEIAWQPRAMAFGEIVEGSRVDLLVHPWLNDFGERGSGRAELGFPSRDTHFCSRRPFLGFEGFLHLADRMVAGLGDYRSDASMRSETGDPSADSPRTSM